MTPTEQEQTPQSRRDFLRLAGRIAALVGISAVTAALARRTLQAQPGTSPPCGQRSACEGCPVEAKCGRRTSPQRERAR